MFIGTGSRWDLSILTGQKISVIGFNSQGGDCYGEWVSLCFISLSPDKSGLSECDFSIMTRRTRHLRSI